MGRPCVTEYEQQREARLSENRKRMEALGLLDLSRSIIISRSSSSSSSKAVKESSTPLLQGTAIPPRKRQKRDHSHPPLPPSTVPSRRSSRLLGATAPCYKEITVTSVKDLSEEVVDSRIRQPEIYTEEHEKLLGPCEQDWELFKDGFGPDGNRIYDSALGKTCHQCRQKTLGLRTSCSRCQTLRGQFCGDCLFMRYGENVLEAQKNKDWVCPGCRGICNCSFCRLKKGWAPTGSMYRQALQMNYKSVAHYLIMTRRGSQPAEVAGIKTNAEGKTDSHIVCSEDEKKIETEVLADKAEQKIESKVLPYEGGQKKIEAELPDEDEQEIESNVLPDEVGQKKIETKKLPDKGVQETEIRVLLDEAEQKIETEMFVDEGEPKIGTEVSPDLGKFKIEREVVDNVKETKLKTIQTDITSIYKQVKMLNPEMLQVSNTGKVKPDSGRMQRKRKNEGKGEIQDACKQMRVTRSRRVQISA